MFACCGKKEKIILAKVRAAPLQPIQMLLLGKDLEITFKLDYKVISLTKKEDANHEVEQEMKQYNSEIKSDLKSEIKSEVRSEPKSEIRSERRERKEEFGIRWYVTKELTGFEKEREQQMLKEKQRAEEEELARNLKEEEEIAQLQEQIQVQENQLREKRQQYDIFNDNCNRIKKESLIIQIKNEMLKKMILEDQELLKEYANYKFN